VAEGLDQYYLASNGKYPDFASWDAMVDPSSPLVKKNLIPPNVPPKDPWDQPYEGKAGKGSYTLKCVGDPNNPQERPPITREPGVLTGGPTGQAAPEGATGDTKK